MFAAERSTFDGTNYRTADVRNVPRPVQAGGPPILVGGGGEQRTLRIAAKHADMTHWFPLGLEALAHKTDVLRRHCEAIGRDPDEIERTMAAPVLVAGTDDEAQAMWRALPPERQAMVQPLVPHQAAEALGPYLDAGFTGFTFNNNVYRTPEQISVLGELLRLVA
jgi:alkanesulfonate monooxygenase SsuD/methylene tetrahydromethanopterin reductase-like flavin-dependent oxidoreductase (luciferase family)